MEREHNIMVEADSHHLQTSTEIPNTKVSAGVYAPAILWNGISTADQDCWGNEPIFYGTLYFGQWALYCFILHRECEKH